MYRAIGTTLACLVLAACATGSGPGSGMTPRTVVGTQCNTTCGQEKASCKGTAAICERTAASCMANCKELDMLNRGR